MDRREFLSGRGKANAKRKVLLVIFQRGAADGLNMLVPHASDDYYRLRPKVRVPRPGAAGGALDLDGYFGLHPSLGPLQKYWDSGQMAAVHAVGSPHSTRSHFTAQGIMEAGIQRSQSTGSGWVGRYLAAQGSANESPFRAVGITSATPAALAGPVPALALRNFNVFDALTDQGPAFLQLAARLHRGDDPLSRQSRLAIQAVQALQTKNPASIQPRNGTKYPSHSFGATIKKAAQLIRADLGVEVIAIDNGAWDTHANQNSRLNSRLKQFAEGINAFVKDMGAEMANVTVVTMSEFGRRASENGSGGTDHGHGGVMFVLGGGVNGGRVFGDWPGLADADLDRGDLQVTTDYRSVLTEVLRQHAGGREPVGAFPDFVDRAGLGLFA